MPIPRRPRGPCRDSCSTPACGCNHRRGRPDGSRGGREVESRVTRTGAGTGYELDVIAAVVIGGTSLSGGRGAIWGTFVGALLMNLLGISAHFQLVVKGLIIIGAVLLDRLRD